MYYHIRANSISSINNNFTEDLVYLGTDTSTRCPLDASKVTKLSLSAPYLEKTFSEDDHAVFAPRAIFFRSAKTTIVSDRLTRLALLVKFELWTRFDIYAYRPSNALSSGGQQSPQGSSAKMLLCVAIRLIHVGKNLGGMTLVFLSSITI